jgi:protein involved in polysaccharide export with SLBB domain
MIGSRWLCLLSALCFLLLLSGCSSPTYREVTEESAVLDAVDQYGVQNGGETYRIKPGDSLRFSFFYDSELNQEVTVRPDGRVSLLLVDDVVVAGRTPEELDKELTEAYATYFTRPEVTVAVLEIAEAKVYIGGEVRYPAMLPLSGRMTALQGIMRSGGFSNKAKVKEVLLVRKSPEGEREIYRLNLRESMQMESALDDIYLQSADLVIVPKKTISKVNQWLDQYIYGIIPLQINVMFRYLYGKNYYVNEQIAE